MSTQRWAVVPTEPTTGMLVAGNHCQPGSYSALLVWKAMVEAAERSGELTYTRHLLQDAESAKLKRVLKAAVELVCAPAWAGVSDEDCELERVLRECGYVTHNVELCGKR